MMIMMIQNKFTGLYWSNQIGWVVPNLATKFSPRDITRLDLPIDGEWVVEIPAILGL